MRACTCVHAASITQTSCSAPLLLARLEHFLCVLNRLLCVCVCVCVCACVCACVLLRIVLPSSRFSNYFVNKITVQVSGNVGIPLSTGHEPSYNLACLFYTLFLRGTILFHVAWESSFKKVPFGMLETFV